MEIQLHDLQKQLAWKASRARLHTYLANQKLEIDPDNSVGMANYIYEKELAKKEVLQMEELKTATAKLDDLKVDAQNPLR